MSIIHALAHLETYGQLITRAAIRFQFIKSVISSPAVVRYNLLPRPRYQLINKKTHPPRGVRR